MSDKMDDLHISPPEMNNIKPRVLVVGIGGAGGNAIMNMRRREIPGVEYLYANTDAQALECSDVTSKLQLGMKLTQGLGAGSDPEIGSEAARESLDSLRDHLEGVNLVFIAAGMGGGTGTGAAPVVAQLARDSGILCVGVVSRPFNYEGGIRRKIANEGIERMRESVDTLITIPNQNLFRVAKKETTFVEAFRMVDDILCEAVRSVTDLMMVHGLINLDFNDVRTILQNKGDAMMGVGECDGQEHGEERGKKAAQQAITNPLLDNGVSLKTAEAMLVNITGGEDLTLFDVDEALHCITEEIDENTNVVHGATIDAQIAGRIRVSIIAAGIKLVKTDTAGGGHKDSSVRSRSSLSSGITSDNGESPRPSWRRHEQSLSPLASDSGSQSRIVHPEQTDPEPLSRRSALSRSITPSRQSAPTHSTPVVDERPFIPEAPLTTTHVQEPLVSATQASSFGGSHQGAGSSSSPLGESDSFTTPEPDPARSETTEPRTTNPSNHPRTFWNRLIGRDESETLETTLKTSSGATIYERHGSTNPRKTHRSLATQPEEKAPPPALANPFQQPPLRPLEGGISPSEPDPDDPLASEQGSLKIPSFLRRQAN